MNFLKYFLLLAQIVGNFSVYAMNEPITFVVNGRSSQNTKLIPHTNLVAIGHNIPVGHGSAFQPAVSLCSTENGKKVRNIKFPNFLFPVVGLAVESTGKNFTLAQVAKNVELFDLETGQEKLEIECNPGITPQFMQFSPDNKQLWVSTLVHIENSVEKGTFAKYDLTTGKHIKTEPIYYAALTPDSTIGVIPKEGFLEMREVETNNSVGSLVVGSYQPPIVPGGVVLSPNHRDIGLYGKAWFTYWKQVDISNYRTNSRTSVCQNGSEVVAALFDQKGKSLVVGSSSEKSEVIKIFDAASGKKTKELNFKGGVDQMDLDDSRLVAQTPTADGNIMVKVWNYLDFEKRKKTLGLCCCCASPRDE